jgi:hypothetical protein
MGITSIVNSLNHPGAQGPYHYAAQGPYHYGLRLQSVQECHYFPASQRGFWIDEVAPDFTGTSLHRPLLVMVHMQTFDRSSFGVGTLTTNRYQPPERVGDTEPSKAALQQQWPAPAPSPSTTSRLPPANGETGRSGDTGRGRGRAAPAASAGLPAGAAGATAAASNHTQPATFMPFASPTYAIPVDPRLTSKVCAFANQACGASITHNEYSTWFLFNVTV